MMTITDTLPRAASALRAHRRAATTDREAAEFVPYSDRQARALARALSRAIAGEVRFSAGDRALYSTDASNYRQVPIGVVVPKSIEDVIATMALCREHGAPLLSRGGGTSLAGQCCNTAVVVDYSKYLNHVLVIDPDSRTAWVEPGVVLDDLRNAAEKFHLTFGPDPATHDHNTLGGMIGNNSCGVHSVMAGRTADNVRELEVLGFSDIFAAGDAVPLVRQHWPLGLEGMDQRLIDHMRAKHLHEQGIESLPEGCGWLIAEFGGESEEEAVTRAQGVIDGLKREGHAVSAKLVRDPKAQKQIWEVRKAGLGASAFVPGQPDTWEGWEDSAVAPERVGDYLRELDVLAKRYGYESVLYGHFGDGCIHCRWNFGLRSEEGVAKWRRFLGEAADLVIRKGGSISGEHGDGQSKAELLGKMLGSGPLHAFR